MARESVLWLELLSVDPDDDEVRLSLIKEARELTKIFGAIVEKSK